MSDIKRNELSVRELIENWAAAICQGDMDGVLANHAPEIVMYDVPEPIQSRGLPAYRETWELFFSVNGPGPDRFRLNGLEILAGKDVAVAYGLVAVAGGSTLCRLTIVLQRRKDGWQVVHEHHSIPI